MLKFAIHQMLCIQKSVLILFAQKTQKYVDEIDLRNKPDVEPVFDRYKRTFLTIEGVQS